MSNILYQVFPVDPKNLTGKGDSPFADLLFMGVFFGAFVEAAIIIISFFFGGYIWLIGLIILIVLWSIGSFFQKQADEDFRRKKSIEESQFYSQKLNDILIKSEEIEKHILPYYESEAKKRIEKSKIEFSDNAYSPFWGEIEEASKALACCKEAINQLSINCEVYNQMLQDKNHNFPLPFPILLKSLSTNILDDYKVVIRKAQTNFEFSNIWEHRKTREILIGGFKTLEQAINGMREDILDSLNDLQKSISSDLRDIKYMQNEQLQSFESNQVLINNTLSQIDTKLYYLQYHKKPVPAFYYK